MDSHLIHAIVYTEIHNQLGPNILYWFPSDLPENIRMLVGIKTVTILSGEHGITPDSLLIIPFPSFKLKGLIKYIEREDTTKRGGYARSAITFLFKEADDLIFYKYMNYLNSSFDEASRKIKDYQNQSVSPEVIFQEIKQLRESICNLLAEFRSKEINPQTIQAFPEVKGKDLKTIDYKFKMVVVGDPGVGKTSTILRFTDNAFLRTYLPTMGVNITEKTFNLKNWTIEIVLWDIAGQSKFEIMRRHFYQGSEALLVIFDLTNPISFRNVKSWYKDLKKNLTDETNIIGYLFGNKSDLSKNRKIKEEDAISMAQELGLKYIETSAKTGRNLENAFYDIAQEVINLRLTTNKC
jgi:small GTP-binding protein